MPSDPEPRTPYRVFVSSTYRENKKRRKLAFAAIRAVGMAPIVMEDFVPETRDQVERCLDEARDADVLVAILGWRYGWTPDGLDGRSITELEIRAKLVTTPKGSRPDVLVFLLDEDERVVVRDEFDAAGVRGEGLRRLDELKQELGESVAPATFTDYSLQANIQEALRKWRDRRERLPAALPPASDDEAEYRRLALGHHRRAPLLGFPDLKFEVLLTDLHVEVDVRMDLRDEGRSEFGDYEEAQKTTGTRDADTIPMRRAFAAAYERGERRGLVLLGEPGSGKTTHLKRTLLRILEGELEGVEGCLPVFLSLSEFRAPARGFVAFAREQVAAEFRKLGDAFAERLLRQDRLVFLLDGLDEVAAEADREQVAGEIKRALHDHPEWRALVSCRFAGYKDRARLSPLCLELHLPTLTPEQAEEYVGNWYRNVERQLHRGPGTWNAAARKRTKALLARLGEPDMRTARVAELRRNPLLLTTLCIVFRKQGKLPERRVDLYARCVQVLIERWLERPGLAGLTPELGVELLRPVATWMHERGFRRASGRDLEPVLAAPLAAAGLELVPGEFLRRVREDCGLLTGWSDELFGFMHLGFQEYLTALELCERAGTQAGREAVAARLAEHLGDDDGWWQEVSLLAQALSPELFTPLLTAYLDDPVAVEHEEFLGYCVRDAARAVPEPFVALLSRDPGRDAALWERQHLALRVLEGFAPDAIPRVADALANHPMEEISGRVAGTLPRIEGHLRGRVATSDEKRGYELVRITGGTFLMGSPKGEPGRYPDEGPQHEVVVPEFYLGRAPVTNEEYARFLRENPKVAEPKHWGDRQYNQPKQPVVGVSWEDARRYCEWAGLVLPTEAQWEYACRAGTTTRYWAGDEESDLSEVGWYSGNSEGRLHAVGEKPANPFGLHDMHGNVWEWCEDDWSGDYSTSQAVHPGAYKQEGARSRVYRGGSWRLVARYARSACRGSGEPGTRNAYLGFRPAKASHRPLVEATVGERPGRSSAPRP